MKKTVGVVGLGLIGGSIAKAIKKKTSHIVYGYDADETTLKKSMHENVIEQKLVRENMKQCDIIVIALYPSDTISFVNEYADCFKRGALILDCAGVKEKICSVLTPFTNDKGLYFIGCHPMAGIEKSGYDNSFAELFDGATMILCSEDKTNTIALKAAEMLFLSIGFEKITYTSSKEHDRIIAFTSQLAHVVSNAYVKSQTAINQSGFAAGSYKDLTRVAFLNESMWTELFFENKENLCNEIEMLINNLACYLNALKSDDKDELKRLLIDGKMQKQQIG